MTEHDTEHILIDCGMTKDAVEDALTAMEMTRGEKVEATVEARLRAAFREMGYEDDGERKVHKVMGKLHDEIGRLCYETSTPNVGWRRLVHKGWYISPRG